MAIAREIARFYGQGKEVKNRDGWLTCCPVHGDTHPSMAVADIGDGDVKVYCHTNNCDFKEIKDRMRTDGVLPEWKPDASKTKNTTAAPATKTKEPAPEEKESFVWKVASKEGLEHASQYLAGRAITIDLPICIKWNSYKDKKSGNIVNMIVAAASKPTDECVYAVQRLFIDLDDHTKSGAKMLGNCEGRGVWFDRKGDMSIIVAGEGIETVLSAMQATGKNGVSTLSTSGMKNLIIPEETEILYILVDSDPVREKEAASMPGQKAAYIMAEKFEASREGRKAFLVTPDPSCFTDNPKKQDFNDLLKEDPTGESIRVRFHQAVNIKDLDWTPPREKEEKESKSPSKILEKYAVQNEYVDNLGNEEFLYDNILIKNHILVIIAESGGGKTTFLFFNVCREIARKGFKVWYFDADSPPSDHKRMKEFADQHGITFLIPDVNLGTSVASLIMDLEKMARAQADLKGFVFVFDTLKKFIDLMSKQSAKDFFVLMRKLTKLGASVILPGHANKHRDSDGNLVFEGVGDIRSDSDDLLFFERVKNADDSLDVTTVVDSDKGAKVRGLFKPISFNIDKSRQITFHDKPMKMIDLSNTGATKATDEDILIAAEKYLKGRGEQVPQKHLVEHVMDIVEGQAGRNRVRGVIVKRAVMKGDHELPYGTRFIYAVGDRNTHLYELPKEAPRQRVVWDDGEPDFQ